MSQGDINGLFLWISNGFQPSYPSPRHIHAYPCLYICILNTCLWRFPYYIQISSCVSMYFLIYLKYISAKLSLTISTIGIQWRIHHNPCISNYIPVDNPAIVGAGPGQGAGPGGGAATSEPVPLRRGQGPELARGRVPAPPPPTGTSAGHGRWMAT